MKCAPFHYIFQIVFILFVRAEHVQSILSCSNIFEYTMAHIRISAPFDLKYILCATQSESNCRHVVVRWKLFYFLLVVVFVVVVVVFGFHCGIIFGVTVVCGR